MDVPLYEFVATSRDPDPMDWSGVNQGAIYQGEAITQRGRGDRVTLKIYYPAEGRTPSVEKMKEKLEKLLAYYVVGKLKKITRQAFVIPDTASPILGLLG